LLLLHSAGCALPAPAPPPPARSVVSSYAVGPPDVLLVTVLPEPVIERSVAVRPDGMISLDLIGDIPAQGRTVSEIAADIESRMARFKRGATASVALVDAQAHTVTVLGEVGRQTTVPLNREMRVAEMIGVVGGPAMFASKGKIRVIRSEAGETMVFIVDLDAITGGDLSTNIELAGGDLIYVPPTFWARVGYAVNALFFPLQPFLGLGRSFAGGLLANAIN
jgi:polysaccharide export outer membrane protein